MNGSESRSVPSFAEARRIILEQLQALEEEAVPLLDSCGRVLASELRAPRALPAFTNSAMDGYAVRAVDCDGRWLRVAGFIPAGGAEVPALAPGEALRIMTGAPVPQGADVIVPIEESEESAAGIRATSAVRLHQHVRFAGEEAGAGELLLPSGTVIRPSEISLLASCEHATVRVVRRPRVAIVSTGDELVEPHEKPSPSQIVNSNAWALAAAVRAAGGVPELLGIARDTRESHREKLAAGLQADVLITSAGVSVGDRDLVRDVLAELGVQSIFWQVRARPGKMLAFGRKDARSVFSVPGNPVSAMLCFEEFVAPALRRLAGHEACVKPTFAVRLEHSVRKKSGHTQLLRAVVREQGGEWLAASAGRQETSRLRTLSAANAVVLLEESREEYAAGEVLRAHWLDDNAPWQMA